MDDDKANKVNANSLTYGFIITIPFSLMVGLLYDMLGRKPVIITTFLVGALSTFLIPVVAPSIIGYNICKVIFFNTLAVLLCNPFINDYVTV